MVIYLYQRRLHHPLFYYHWFYIGQLEIKNNTIAKTSGEFEQEFIQTAKEKTGKTLEQWLPVIKATGLSRQMEIVNWLKSGHHFNHLQATLLAGLYLNNGEPVYQNESSLLDNQLAKAGSMRELYNIVAEKIMSLFPSTPLLKPLDAWHLRWSAPAATRAEDSVGRDWANAAIEEIANALEEILSWRLSEAEATRISSRFINRRAQDRWASNRSTAQHLADIRVQPPRNPGDAPTFFVTNRWLTGIEQLLAQLRVLPGDRVWIWEPDPDPYLGFSTPYPAQPTSMWFPGQEEALFQRVGRRARAFGQTFRRP